MSIITCSVQGCENTNLKGFGWCNKHYLRFYKTHPNYKPRDNYNDRRKHPFYLIWWQRKRDKLLCNEWLDFLKFVEGVSPKPDGEFYLIRIKDDLFGPDNFKWIEHLRKQEGESFRAWNARKRAARLAANPSMESDRNLKRKYGLTRQQYEEKLKNQNFVCAICGEKETATNGITGTLKLLAVDHCHKTNKIRGLLCWRCNGTLGKIEDNRELLLKMVDYLDKHAEA